MADLFQPVNHVDGELFDATDLNRLEDGVEALDVEVADLRETVDSLTSGTGGGTSGAQPSGPRGLFSPTMGAILLDTSLSPPRFIGGYGTEWRNLDGTAITTAGGGGQVPGTSTAPANMAATVTAGGSIGAINLSWSAVTNASFYTLYETESPNGVSGATALTTTSSVRTPGTARNYEYWVTATVGGVESAASNHVTAVLPFSGSGGGAPTGTDPSTFLNINGKGTGTGGWWNLGHGIPGGAHVDITPTQLQGSYVNSPHYVMNASGTGVQFQTFMNSGTTSGSQYPREELREFATGSTSTRASWSGTSGNHFMSYRAKMIHFAPAKQEVCIGQIHDGADDRMQIRAEGTNWVLKVNGNEYDEVIATGIALGTEVFVEIRVNNGLLTVRFNGSQKYSANPGYSSSGNYFKLGCYAQQNVSSGNPSSEYARCEVRDIVVTHS